MKTWICFNENLGLLYDYRSCSRQILLDNSLVCDKCHRNHLPSVIPYMPWEQLCLDWYDTQKLLSAEQNNLSSDWLTQNKPCGLYSLSHPGTKVMNIVVFLYIMDVSKWRGSNTTMKLYIVRSHFPCINFIWEFVSCRMNEGCNKRPETEYLGNMSSLRISFVLTSKVTFKPLKYWQMNGSSTDLSQRIELRMFFFSLCRYWVTLFQTVISLNRP